MRPKLCFIILTVVLCFTLFPGRTSVLAEEPTTSTVETPTPTPIPTPQILPVDVIYDEDQAEIRKIYDLEPETAQSAIQTDTFDLNGYRYTCFDILQEDVEETVTKLHSESVTVSSKSNETATVLALLDKYKEVTTEDGFSGVLYLDTQSVHTEVSGYGTKTYTVTATRSYPNLSDADMQYIPKTIEDNGRTLQFESVDWQTDNTQNIDDYEIADRYTAVVTYAGSASESYVKGYTVYATYTGEVTKINLDKIRYTVIFKGTLIPPPEEPEPWLPSWAYWGIPAGAIALGGGGLGLYYLLKKRKRKETEYAQDPDYVDSGDIPDFHSDDPSLGA